MDTMNTSTSSSSTGDGLSYEANLVVAYILPIIIFLILTTNIINISVLCRRVLRKSSCTHYFLALSICNLFYLPFTPLSIFISYCFGVSMSSTIFGCKIQFFFIFSLALFFVLMLVCASIDRYCSSSPSLHLRSFSNRRIARRVILIVSLSITIYICPFFIIDYWDYSANRCAQYSNIIIVVYLSSRVVLSNIVGPLAMTVFGVLTIHNIRSQAHRIAPVVRRQRRRRRTERQLSVMLIIQVGTYVTFSLPNAVTYILTTFVPSMVTPLVSAVRIISVIWLQGTFFLSFFLYILSAEVYRNELKKMFHLNRNQVQQTFLNAHPQVFPLRNNVAINAP